MIIMLGYGVILVQFKKLHETPFSLLGKLITKCLGHDSKITDVAWFPRQSSPEGHMTFLSSSHDQHIHLWTFDPNENEESVQLKVICKGHSRSVEAIAVSPSKENCKVGNT